MSASSSRLFESLAPLHPEGAEALRDANDVARRATDRDLLELCLDHADALLSGREPARAPRGERERAFVEFAEQYATSVASVSERQVAALREHASDEEVYAFICSLYVREMTRRVELVAAEVLP